MAASPTRSRSISTGSRARCSRTRTRRRSSNTSTASWCRAVSANAAPKAKSARRSSPGERDVPRFPGICFGLQMAVIEAARNLVGIEEANSTEFGPTPEPLVGLMTEWLRGNELEKYAFPRPAISAAPCGFGAYPAMPQARQPGVRHLWRRHRDFGTPPPPLRGQHRLQGSPRAARPEIFRWLSPDGSAARDLRRIRGPSCWFIRVQFHPELKSRPFEPHPLFASFIQAAVVQSRLV